MNKTMLSLFLAAALPSTAAMTEPAGLSDKLRPTAAEEPAFVLAAEGVQIYTCKQKDAYAYGWTFLAPEASLSEAGSTVGRHFAGPTWESSSDRSSVQGVVKERQDGGAGNIPWLLLAARPADTPGKFAGVTSIQRVSTKGGVEPKDTCDASNVGKEMRVPYTADYYFFKRK